MAVSPRSIDPLRDPPLRAGCNARRRATLGPLALLTALAVTPRLGAQELGVEALIERGLEARRQADDESALRDFRRAWELTRSPRARAQMAMAEQALGQWAEADAHLRDALSSATDPWIERNHTLLASSLAAVGQHLGRLEVRGGVPGAQVFLNGTAVGAMPLPDPLRAVAGSAQLRVTAEGYLPVERTVVITGGTLSRETVEMTPLTAAPTRRAPAGGDPTQGGPTPPTAPPEDTGVGGQRVAAWVTLGLGVVATGVGIAGHVLREGRVANFDRRSDGHDCMVDPVNGQAYGGVDCAGELDAIDSAGTMAIVGYSAGGALLVSSVFLFVLGPRPGRGRARVGCGPMPLFRGATCSISF